ncbi:acyltransferase family protein [Pseudobutyrivibrio xylanivorans]|uniref:Acyltransferase family protein n=1 Tax=Pseudobutyrivibrio xylanivorans DSM 14809 TaxID=1123012 RepID=A0A1M6CD26_PSEXY|nr:acyltransferase [Pseudobutyrivibrio xylanivorans]SHI58955.1 Acyltransferase family protein [Pseudobutyrivibrio xylanivorans DSM 14809]
MNRDIVNKGRQKELDWAKAFTILVMVTIHCYEQISIVDTEVVPTGIFRNVLEFLGGPLGAPLFMFCMGVGIMYSHNSTPADMGKRGVKLLRNGYLLSFVKGTIPTVIAIYLGYAVPWTVADSLFLVSILQFAGMAFFAIALMKKFNLSLPVMMGISLVLSIIGGELANIDLTDSWTQYLWGLFFNTNDVTTFPLFRWLYYPIFGMIFAYFLQRTEDKSRFYRRIFPVALFCTIAFSIIYVALGYDIRSMYMLSGRVIYKQSLLHYVFATFVILTAMPLHYVLSEKVKLKSFSGAVAYLGKNLDVIYLVQWVIIVYLQSFLNIFGYIRITVPYIIPVGMLVLISSIGAIELGRLIKRKKTA